MSEESTNKFDQTLCAGADAISRPFKPLSTLAETARNTISRVIPSSQRDYVQEAEDYVVTAASSTLRVLRETVVAVAYAAVLREAPQWGEAANDIGYDQQWEVPYAAKEPFSWRKGLF